MACQTLVIHYCKFLAKIGYRWRATVRGTGEDRDVKVVCLYMFFHVPQHT